MNPFVVTDFIHSRYIIRHYGRYSEVAQKDNITQSPDLREHDSPVSPIMTQKAPLISVVQSD